jgi:hypothetical protein
MLSPPATCQECCSHHCVRHGLVAWLASSPLRLASNRKLPHLPCPSDLYGRALGSIFSSQQTFHAPSIPSNMRIAEHASNGRCYSGGPRHAWRRTSERSTGPNEATMPLEHLVARPPPCRDRALIPRFFLCSIVCAIAVRNAPVVADQTLNGDGDAKWTPRSSGSSPSESSTLRGDNRDKLHDGVDAIEKNVAIRSCRYDELLPRLACSPPSPLFKHAILLQLHIDISR